MSIKKGGEEKVQGRRDVDRQTSGGGRNGKKGSRYINMFFSVLASGKVSGKRVGVGFF